MKTTPYQNGNGNYDSYSMGRTSKVKYANERLVPETMVLSKRIELSTRFNLFHEHYASENYQIMNYGIGGKISSHLDESPYIFSNKSEDDHLTNEYLLYGGLRLVTVMIYLSSVEAGGHTVFPQAGISVKPKMGSAIYWFNIGARNNFDSRTYHLGCPVLYGNKWIANKWVKWQPSYQNYPCHIHKKHYAINEK